MKTTWIAVAWLLIAPAAASAQGARLQLDHLDRLAAKAAETVNISIDPSMLKLASSFMSGNGENASIKDLLAGLKGIYVKVFEFEQANVYTSDDVNAVRKQLTRSEWQRLVTVDSKRDGELVEVYSWRERGESGGLAVLVAEPTELTVVNIVGPIDLEKLGKLQGQFGIPRVPAAPGR